MSDEIGVGTGHLWHVLLWHCEHQHQPVAFNQLEAQRILVKKSQVKSSQIYLESAF